MNEKPWYSDCWSYRCVVLITFDVETKTLLDTGMCQFVLQCLGEHTLKQW